jgi:hypothetical protein
MQGAPSLEKDNQLIDELGGPTKVAEICGGISPQAASQWRRHGIPSARRMFFEAKFGDLYRRIFTQDTSRV